MRSSTLSATLDHIPVPVRAFVARRMAEALGILILLLSAAYTLALVTWSVRDPSLNHATAGPIHNLLGFKGAIVADLTMQLIGIAAVALLLPPLLWSWRLLRRRQFDSAKWRLILWICGTLCAAGLASLLPVTGRWPLPTGLGGVFGDALISLPRRVIGASPIAAAISAAALLIATILCLAGSIGVGAAREDRDEDDEDFSSRETRSDDDAAGEPGLVLVALGALIHGLLSARAALRRTLINAKRRWSNRAQSADPNTLPAVVPVARREPSFAAPTFDPSLYAPPSVREAAEHAPRASNAAITPSRRTSREPARGKRNSYQLPALQLLSEAKKSVVTKISEEALEQNARLLEGVLDDFGVKGEIIQV
ncbi:MAG: DNA translocase FtsK 4TM domain-containing protein, partial [Methylobacteriaceae bacterium]|nr:DNA translocase FtsK 4TM domain-containing protein [Methylobacteriaceae bacterium]